MKLLLFMLTLSFSTMTSAETCRILISKENPPIRQNVGSHWGTNPLSGGLYYHPGEVYTFTDRSHWSFLFDSAVFYGVSSYSSDEESKMKKNILKKFSKDIEEDCQIVNSKKQKDSYEILRNILKELVEDGSFCPGDKVLDRPLLSPWNNYRKILKDAVASGRFSDVCAGENTLSDSSREVKDVGSSVNRSSPPSQSANQQ